MIPRLMRLKIGKTSRETDIVLRHIVNCAYTRVPFYRHTWDAAGVSVAEFRGREDLPLLPIVTKDSLLSRGLQDRIGTSVNLHHSVRRGTSGTSGAPIEVHMTRPEFRFRQLVLLMAMCSNAGFAFPFDIVEAGAWIPPTRSESVIRHQNLVTRATYISRNAPLEEQARMLARTKPTVLTGSPSSLQIIASELLRLGRTAPQPRITVVRGEVLRSDVRSLLSQVFGGRIFDYYNTQEIGNIARQCSDRFGLMHVNHDTCVVEILDDDGMPVSPGEEGDVVVTSLYSMAMPLLRYRLADRAILVQSERTRCPCGRQTEIISPPLGRDDDLVVLPDLQRVSSEVLTDLVMAAGRRVGIESTFTRSVQFQIIQESLTHITVRIASCEPASKTFRVELARSIQALHHQLTCAVEEVPEIDLGETGKLKRVLSHVTFPPRTGPMVKQEPAWLDPPERGKE